MSRPDYEIVEVDLRDPSFAAQFLEVTAESIRRPVPTDHVILNTYLEAAGQRTLYLAALEDGRLMGFNAFIAHQMIWRRAFLPTYQSCWTFTSPRFRGRGVFTSIIEEAKRILRDRGAAVLLGWANPVSHPIFLHKLGFADQGGFQHTNILAAGPLVKQALTRDAGSLDRALEDGSLAQNDSELIALKRPQTHAGGYVEFHDAYANSGWGMVRTVRRRGLPLRYLMVGGIKLNNPGRLHELILGAARRHRAHVIQFVYHHTSSLRHLFRRRRDSPTVSPQICFGLNMDPDEFQRFNFFTGVFDTF